MHSNEPASPGTSLDADTRRVPTDRLGWVIGNAIARQNGYQLAYALGRLDEEIGALEDRNYKQAQIQLRDAICAALNIYPKLHNQPAPDPASSAEVVRLVDELSS